MARIRDLFIPRKTNGKAPQPDYGTDMRSIETWAKEVNNQLATIPSGGGGGYASLTGPGQTVTPGALTQHGDFTISNGQLTQGGANVSLGNAMFTIHPFGSGSGVGIGNSVLGTIFVGGGASASGGVTVNTQYFGSLIQISALDPAGGNPSGGIVITTAGGSISVSAGSSASGTHGTTNIGGGGFGEKLSFFGQPGATRQPAGATLADLVTALRAYGLIS